MITIVSGLPRCGTSLMMRMLEMSGLPVLVDGVREADEDNPRGYYELEAVKQVAKDASFLDDADGKVFKMVSQLLPDLPRSRDYKVVFMRRDMAEMMASQNKMLERRGEPLAGDDEKIVGLFEKHLEQMQSWLESARHIDVLYVSYNELMVEPGPIIEQVNEFLGGQLDTEAMASAIDKNLYRQRKTAMA